MNATADSHIVDEVLDSLRGDEQPAIDILSPPAEPRERRFVPISALRARLTAPVISRILVYLHLHATDRDIIRERYLVVFAILLSLGKGYYIRQFIHYPNLEDTHLPFLSSDGWHPNCKQFFQDFIDQQWRFCPQPLKKWGLSGTIFPDKSIIPILERNLLKGGPDSSTWRVTIHKDYNDLVDKDENGTPVTDTFVLKTCSAKHSELHDREVGAYKIMNGQTDCLPNMARYYGSFTLGSSHNFFLEWVGGGTLDQYLLRTSGPTKPEDIIKIWEQISGLIKVVERIHKVPAPGDPERYLQGIHHDIKPSNILVSKPIGQSKFDVEFKLADLGHADFRPEAQDGQRLLRRDVGSTTQWFSPPECWLEEQDLSSPRRVKDAEPKKDIWSLGCVLSLFAVWTVLGKDGYLEYEKARRTETEQIPAIRKTAYSGGFHDGEKVLQSVQDTHVRLQRECRKSDDVILTVISVIETMPEEAHVRPDAARCYEKFRKILNSARRRLGHDEPPEEAYPECFRDEPPDPEEDEGEERESERGSSRRVTRPQSQPLPGMDPRLNGASPNRRSAPVLITNGSELNTPEASHRRNISKGLPTLEECPSITVNEVLSLIKNKKQGHSPSLKLPNAAYLNPLDERDHVFLFDDSTSMRSHWEDAKSVFEALAYLVKGRDPDGIEIRFTNDDKRRAQKKNRAPLLEILDSMTPTGNFDIGLVLGKILERYYPGNTRGQKIFRRSSKKWGLNVYVLTDCAPRSRKDPLAGVVAPIKNLVDRLIESGKTRGPVAIQFIRFGDNAVAAGHFKNLDAHPEVFGIKMDIVDTEHYKGNVYKMLLGAVSDNWDERERDR